ncbi:MAG: histidine kinase [Bacteroidia bacterium]|nr:histidine kinase [Bacteroidia bacterium]
MKHSSYCENSLGLYKAFMSSHATFNSLSAIQNMIVSNDTREALSNLSKFARFIRRFSACADQSYHSFTAETELLNSYLELERLRFSEHLTFNIKISDSLKDDSFSVPTLLLMPLLEQQLLSGLKAGLEEIVLTLEFTRTKNILEAHISLSEAVAPAEDLQLSNEQVNRLKLFNDRVEIYNTEIAGSVMKSAQGAGNETIIRLLIQ